MLNWHLFIFGFVRCRAYIRKDTKSFVCCKSLKHNILPFALQRIHYDNSLKRSHILAFSFPLHRSLGLACCHPFSQKPGGVLHFFFPSCQLIKRRAHFANTFSMAKRICDSVKYALTVRLTLIYVPSTIDKVTFPEIS